MSDQRMATGTVTAAIPRSWQVAGRVGSRRPGRGPRATRLEKGMTGRRRGYPLTMSLTPDHRTRTGTDA